MDLQTTHQETPLSNEPHGLQRLLGNKPHAFILLFLLVLSSISFYTTYDGLIRFSYGSFSQTPLIFIIVLFLFVTVLQGMLLFSLYELLHSRLFVKSLWLIVYLVTMGVSVFFSYSFYYNLFRAESYAFDNFSAQLKQIKNSALNYQEAFLQIKDDTEKLADYSRRRAEEERQRGGTCGYMSPPKSGPRSRYRDKEAKIFTALSSDISDLYDEVSADIRQLEDLVKNYAERKENTDAIQDQMNKVVQKLNGYKPSGKVLNLKSTLRGHMYDRRKTDGKDELGYPITCPDENIDIKGTAIIKQVDVMPEVQEVALFDPNSDREVLSRALSVFMQVPKALLPESFLNKLFLQKTREQAAATQITSLDYAPMLLGALIDLFIFIVGLADGLENRRRHWDMKAFSGRYIQLQDIETMGQVANEEMFLTTLRSHMAKSRLGISLFIPASTNALNDQSRGIMDLVEAMESSDMLNKPWRYNLGWNELPEQARHSLREIYADAEERLFSQYRMPNMVWKELQQAYYAWHIYHDMA